ncbi:SPOR domain-containing protein [Sphingomonas colocasiae]|uniref:SPOR domain-containing protein n=1 Tax=Sphingomonas colocasiae TaxID=1848973 RepID=A0ABS7PIR2_9SPHN|nr:SPOR domain-containing protein [Sphingomonas colocasiae]MBY8821113.1 SPOR domain-containing protein [Sphingomonas colocasiae]
MRLVGMMGLGLALASLTAPALADVKAGVDAWQRGDYAAAIKEWRPAAIAGDPDAQFNLAQAYKLGRGLPVDLKQAESWYQKAAAQGHIQAADNYGLILFQNGNRKEALPWIQKSADRGEPRAQYVLGTALFNGDLTEKDWIRAYALMTRASSAGLPQASTTLAQMDQYIPLDQRQKGTALARDLELKAARPQSAAIAAAELPPSQPAMKGPGTSYPPPGQPAPAPVTRPAAPPPARTQAAATPAAPKPMATVATPARSGPWRIQLGAFSEPGRAKALWSSLERNVSGLGGLQPFMVKAGAITKLQAGPFQTKAQAESQCAAVKRSGQACLAVKA